MTPSVKVSGVDRVIRRLNDIGTADYSMVIDVVTNRQDGPRVIDKLRARGAVFLSRRDAVALSRMIQKAAVDTVKAEWKTGSSSRSIYVAIGRKATGYVKSRITSGGLGTNATKYAKRKSRMAKAGKMSTKYGDPPPYGVATAALVDNIRAQVLLGRD